MTDSTEVRDPVSANTTLRWVTAVFAVALLVPGADHLRRGMDTMSMLVMTLGTVQLLLAAGVIVLVFTRDRRAPIAAITVGFLRRRRIHRGASVLGLVRTAQRQLYRCATVGTGHGFSWFAAFFEIAADLAIGVAGLRTRRSWP